jgi:hypothetical protein
MVGLPEATMLDLSERLAAAIGRELSEEIRTA